MLYGFLPYVQPIFATDAKLQDKFQFTHRPIKIKLKTTMFFKYRCEMNFFRFILLCFWRIDVAVGAIKAENSFNISMLEVTVSNHARRTGIDISHFFVFDIFSAIIHTNILQLHLFSFTLQPLSRFEQHLCIIITSVFLLFLFDFWKNPEGGIGISVTEKDTSSIKK